MNNAGRIDYWRAKSRLCEKLFYEQVQDKEKQDEAVENLARFIHANREVERLTHGQDYAWLFTTGEAD